MSDLNGRQTADSGGSSSAPLIVVIAEDWATSRRRARDTRLVVLACALLGIAAFVAPRVIGPSEVRAAASTPPPIHASSLVAAPATELRAPPLGPLAVGPLPNAVATLEARGVRVRKMTAEEVRATSLENAAHAWIVANLAPGVAGLAIGDIILGRCVTAATDTAGADAPLPICIMRSGQIYTMTL